MKKIFAILLAMVVVLSMGVTSFAADWSNTETPTEDFVRVTVILTENYHEVFESHKVEEKVTEVKGTNAKFKIGIENYTDTPVKWDEVLANFDIVVKTKDKKDNIKIIDNFYSEPGWLNGGDSLKNYVNAEGGKWGHDFGMKILTERDIWFEVSLGGKTEKILATENKAEFILVTKDETITTTTIPTTVAPTEPSVETTTEAPTTVTTTLPNESETGGVDDELYPDVGDGSDYFDNTTTTKKPSNVESDIPNTGSGTAGIIAFGVLGVAALAALKMRKKKIDD